MISWNARKGFIDEEPRRHGRLHGGHAAHHALVRGSRRTTTRWPQIASKITKAPPERFGWLFTKQDTYRDPNLIPNLDALQRNVDITRELGFVKKKIDINKYADLSLVQEAAKRLK